MTSPPPSDPALLDVARKQPATVLASGNPLAFPGLRAVWCSDPDVSNDDLSGLAKEADAAGLIPEPPT